MGAHSKVAVWMYPVLCACPSWVSIIVLVQIASYETGLDSGISLDGDGEPVSRTELNLDWGTPILLSIVNCQVVTTQSLTRKLIGLKTIRLDLTRDKMTVLSSTLQGFISFYFLFIFILYVSKWFCLFYHWRLYFIFHLMNNNNNSWGFLANPGLQPIYFALTNNNHLMIIVT